MKKDAEQPPSVGSKIEPPATVEPEPALLRLHASLKQLDVAIHDTLRAVEVALGREPTNGPPDGLPFRELGRLKLHLEAANRPAQASDDRSLGDMALDWEDDELDAEADEDEPREEDARDAA